MQRCPDASATRVTGPELSGRPRGKAVRPQHVGHSAHTSWAVLRQPAQLLQLGTLATPGWSPSSLMADWCAADRMSEESLVAASYNRSIVSNTCSNVFIAP